MYKIVDIHIHIFPDELAKKAVPLLASDAGIEPQLDGTIQAIKGSMKESGIDISVNQPIATKPSQVRTINLWAKDITDNEIISFGTLHPDYNGWKEEIAFIKDMGLPGVKLHPDYQSFFVDEARMFPIYEALFQAGLVILFHAGVDIGLPSPYHCTPERLLRVIQAFPEGNIIAAHMGGYDYWDEVEKHLVGENIFFDTSYSSDHMETNRMVKIVNEHGADKILFGTDSPWKSQKREVQAIKELPLSEEAKRLILGENALKLLSNT